MTDENKGTELSVSRGGALSTGNADSPEYQEALRDIWQGIEQNVQDGDLTISRIAILQPGSPEVSGEVAGYKAGMLVDNLSRVPLSSLTKPPWLKGKMPEEDFLRLPDQHICAILPVYRLPNEYIKWIPKNQQVAGEDQWEWKTLDISEDRVRAGLWKPKGTWNGEGSPPVTENMNFLCIPIDMETGLGLTNFVVNSFSRTSYKTGKRLHGFLEGHRMGRLAPWDRIYYLHTERKFNEKSNAYYYIMHVTQGQVLRGRDGTYSDLVDTELIRLSAGMSSWLRADRMHEEQMINAAAFSDEYEDEKSSSGSSNPVDDDDPFSSVAVGSDGSDGADGSDDPSDAEVADF